MPADSITDPASGLPIGPLVNAPPARRPERIVLRGRLVTIAPLDPAKHAQPEEQVTDRATGPRRARGLDGHVEQLGRASCRERVFSSV